MIIQTVLGEVLELSAVKASMSCMAESDMLIWSLPPLPQQNCMYHVSFLNPRPFRIGIEKQ